MCSPLRKQGFGLKGSPLTWKSTTLPSRSRTTSSIPPGTGSLPARNLPNWRAKHDSNHLPVASLTFRSPWQTRCTHTIRGHLSLPCLTAEKPHRRHATPQVSILSASWGGPKTFGLARTAHCLKTSFAFQMEVHWGVLEQIMISVPEGVEVVVVVSGVAHAAVAKLAASLQGSLRDSAKLPAMAPDTGWGSCGRPNRGN